MKVSIGVTYRCVGGWFRRPTDFRTRLGLPYDEVRYDAGRTPDRLSPQKMWNALPWFENHVVEAYEQGARPAPYPQDEPAEVTIRKERDEWPL